MNTVLMIIVGTAIGLLAGRVIASYAKLRSIEKVFKNNGWGHPMTSPKNQPCPCGSGAKYKDCHGI